MNHHIAILFHEADRGRVHLYAVSGLAEIWRRDGHTVTYIFGVRKFIPADLILVHVDLSVVPEEYTLFAQQYPIVLNDKPRDIRKSKFSRHLLSPDDDYSGQVFIKADLNYAGIPEEVRLKRKHYFRSLLRILNIPFFQTPADYLVLKSLQDVPLQWFERRDMIVQRFCPEFEEGLYHVRLYQFLGDRHTCTRVSSPRPVVNDLSSVRSVSIEVHPEIEKIRYELKFDYGKFDYVIHNGEPVLLDINKTTGAVRKLTPEIAAMRRHRAEGIYSYFQGNSSSSFLKSANGLPA